MDGQQAFNEAMKGKTVVAGGRYYKYNRTQGTMQYSDDKREWKNSNITREDFIRFGNWVKD